MVRINLTTQAIGLSLCLVVVPFLGKKSLFLKCMLTNPWHYEKHIDSTVLESICDAKEFKKYKSKYKSWRKSTQVTRTQT